MGGRWWPGSEPPEHVLEGHGWKHIGPIDGGGEAFVAEIPDERPDPLAEPPRRAKPDPAMAELSGVCGYWQGSGDSEGHNCSHEVSEVWWVGCTAGEHAGPAEWCRCHAKVMVRMGPQAVTCGQCSDAGHGGVPMKVFRRTRPDGLELPLPWVFAAEGGDGKLHLLTELFGGDHG